VSNDLPRVLSYVTNGGGNDAEFGEPPSVNDWATIMFRSNASRSRAFLIGLALAMPKNLLNGVAIDTSEALSAFNKKQYHHVYPRAFLKRSKETLDDNLLANICMLSAAANLKISDDEPSDYIPAIVSEHGVEPR
jgi:hypothetical protein